MDAPLKAKTVTSTSIGTADSTGVISPTLNLTLATGSNWPDFDIASEAASRQVSGRSIAAIRCASETALDRHSCWSGLLPISPRSSLRYAAWAGDAQSAVGRPLCAAYAPVEAGGRASGADPLLPSSPLNSVPQCRHSFDRSSSIGAGFGSLSTWAANRASKRREALPRLVNLRISSMRDKQLRCTSRGPKLEAQAIRIGVPTRVQSLASRA